MGHRLFERNVLQPVFIRVFCVPDLIHHAHGVAGLGVDGLKQGHGVNDGVERKNDLLARKLQFTRNFFDAWFPLVFTLQFLPYLKHAVRCVAHTAGNPDGAVVAKIPADLAQDHRHAIGAEAQIQVYVKIIDRLQKTHTADLKEVVRIFAAIGKALDHGKDQSQIPFDQPFTRALIALFHAAQQLVRFLSAQRGQLCRVDPADLYLSKHFHASRKPDAFSISATVGIIRNLFFTFRASSMDFLRGFCMGRPAKNIE